MANEKQLLFIMRGVSYWNEWRTRYIDEVIDLSYANLSNLDLSGINLYKATLYNTDFSNSNLQYAILNESNLSEAYMVGADFYKAKICNANCNKADFTKSNLNNSDLIYSNFSRANFSYATLQFAKLINANLKNSLFLDTHLENATIQDCFVHGISTWNIITNESTNQAGLIISNENEPVITVDSLKIAQFMYLMLNNKEIREIIDTMTSKIIVILGRFTKQRKLILDSIREELKKHNYVPVMYDFTSSQSRDTLETITLLARMSRFVIADITSPRSIPEELTSIVETLPSLIIQPIICNGQLPWGMYDHIKQYPWVLPLQEYKNKKDIINLLSNELLSCMEAKLAQNHT